MLIESSSAISQAPIAPINMIGTISHSHIALVNGITRIRAQAQVIAPEELSRSREVNELCAKRDVPMYYPNAKVELER